MAPTGSHCALHANAMNLMAQRGETTAMQRAIDQGANINDTDKDWFPLMMAVAAFSAFVALGNELTAEKAFTALAAGASAVVVINSPQSVR